MYTAVSLSPASANLTCSAAQQFAATALDQFGQPLSSQPSFTWSLTSGLGTLTSGGLYTPPYAAGSASIRAASGSYSATATVNYSSQAQWNASSSGSWNTGGNWNDLFTGSSLSAPGVRGMIGDTILFSAGAGPVARLDGATPSLAGITFNSATISYTINQGSGGSLTLQGGGNSATISVLAGSHTISAPVHLVSNTAVSVAATTMLTITTSIDGSGSLTTTAAGKLVLAAANTFSGGLFVQSGTVIVNSAAGLLVASNLTIGDPGPFASPTAPIDSASAIPSAAPTTKALSPFAVAAVMAGLPIGPPLPPWLRH
jgi:autotransporter-associated beta strand protein